MHRITILRRAVLCVVIIAAACVPTVLVHAQDAEPLSLQLKFTVGQVATWEIRSTGNLPVSVVLPPDLGGMVFQTNLDTFMEAIALQETTELNEEGALQKFSLSSMAMNQLVAADQQFINPEMKLEDGQMTLKVNGQEQPLDNQVMQAVEAMQSPVVFQVKADGGCRPVEASEDTIRQLLAATGLTARDFAELLAASFILPEESVRPGDSWDRLVQIENDHNTIAGVSKMTFTGVENLDDTPCARIEGTVLLNMVGETPAMPFPGMDVNVTIRTMNIDMKLVHFIDYQAGEILQSNIEMTQNAEMEIKAGAGGNVPIPGSIPATVHNAQTRVEMHRKYRSVAPAPEPAEG